MNYKSSIIKFLFSNRVKVQKFLPRKNKNELQPFYPKQHPQKLNSHDSRILRHDKPLHYVTPVMQTPYEVHLPAESSMKQFQAPPNSKYLEIALVGPPNSGKSSLINKLINYQVSAVSNKSNTTYEDIIGYYTNFTNNTQIVIHDTPGITKRYKSSSHYVTEAWKVINDCAKVLFVVDAVKIIDDQIREAIRRLNTIKYSEKDQKILDNLSKEDAFEDPEKIKQMIQQKQQVTQKGQKQEIFESKTVPKILVMNKMDLCTNKKKLRWITAELEDLGKFDKIIHTSCVTGFGLDELKQYLEQEATAQPWQYHPDAKTVQSKADLLEDVMKSAIFSRFYYEIPYQVGITLTEFALRSDGLAKVEFALDVQTEIQQKIITGYRGRNIQIMQEKVRSELIQMYKKDFIISIQVKRRSDNLYKQNQKIQSIADERAGENDIEQKIINYKQGRQQLNAQIDQYIDNPALQL